MTHFALHELHRARLHWPEPLVLELIAEIYRAASAHDDIGTAARLHARFLCHLVEGETPPAGAARLELIASCAARAIDPESIERAEQSALRELTGLARSRFRHSPRQLRLALAKLQTARDVLTKRDDAPSRPLRKSIAKKTTRVPLQLKPTLVPAY